MIGRCCVFQPFDNGGPYDKRYDEVISPAIEAAELEPYRVDRDPGAEIPIDTLHDEIRRSAACLADITPDNPNVWYELGYAVASDQPVVMICKKGRKLPFDMHHRSTAFYELESPKDFDQLKNDITTRLRAAITKRAKVQDVVSASPVKATEGLEPHEISTLALIIANRDSAEDYANTHWIREGMRKAGYTDVATSVALTSLERNGYVRSEERQVSLEESFFAYWLTDKGEEWLLKNQDKLEMRQRPRSGVQRDLGIRDDDVPF